MVKSSLCQPDFLCQTMTDRYGSKVTKKDRNIISFLEDAAGAPQFKRDVFGHPLSSPIVPTLFPPPQAFSLPLRRMTKRDDCEGMPGYPGNNNEGIAW